MSHNPVRPMLPEEELRKAISEHTRAFAEATATLNAATRRREFFHGFKTRERMQPLKADQAEIHKARAANARVLRARVAKPRANTPSAIGKQHSQPAAEFALSLFCPVDRVEEIMFHLEEKRDFIAAKFGPGRARVWYVWRVTEVAAAYVIDKLKTALGVAEKVTKIGGS